MIVMLHVIIALASITFTSLAYLSPSTIKLRASYGLAALTLASGLYLVINEPAHMLQSCLMGVAYLAVVGAGIVATRHKLIAVKENV